MDAKDIRNLQEAYLEVYQELDEEEGSYGQTPKARAAMGKVAIARREKPASEYSQKGEKTKKVREIEKHTRRIDNGPDAGNRGKRSTSPRWSGFAGKSGRGKLDQDARDYARERDVEYSAGENKPGSGTVTKNPKKLRKQKAMGEIGEQLDIYDIILSHLLDEGYAETPEAAEVIMVNMSEEWREGIVEMMGGVGGVGRMNFSMSRTSGASPRPSGTPTSNRPNTRPTNTDNTSKERIKFSNPLLSRPSSTIR